MKRTEQSLITFPPSLEYIYILSIHQKAIKNVVFMCVENSLSSTATSRCCKSFMFFIVGQPSRGYWTQYNVDKHNYCICLLFIYLRGLPIICCKNNIGEQNIFNCVAEFDRNVIFRFGLISTRTRFTSKLFFEIIFEIVAFSIIQKSELAM